MVVFLELSVTQSHGGLKVLGMNLCGDIFGCLDGLHERGPHDLVLADGDDGRWRLGRHLENSTNSLNTLQGGEPSVVSTSRTTSLGVTQNGGSGIQAQPLCKDILDGRARNLVELAILRSLGDNDNRAALATLLAVLLGEKKWISQSYMIHAGSALRPYLGNNRAHVVLPAIPRGNLGDEQPVCTSTNSGHES